MLNKSCVFQWPTVASHRKAMAKTPTMTVMLCAVTRSTLTIHRQKLLRRTLKFERIVIDSNSSPQPDIYSFMRNQPSRDIIRFLLETEQDMNLTEQELDQWIEQRDQEAEEEIKSILQKISAETMSAIPLESVEVKEVTPLEDYWSEEEETLVISLHEPYIEIAHNTCDEVEKDIEVVSERPEEPQKESKEDQSLVLVKPPTLPRIFVRPYKGVEVKESSQIFYTADTFVLDDQDEKESFALEVLNELLILKEGVQAALPIYVDAPFVVDISK
ncbi:hypothetical protein Sjap_009444 [Stephania japonica]|uniref:Uncharacterized protein n=1 Tax=Stephania japonica TaxID=461633 RepID=A0AAP0PFI2_9MAGN